MISYTSSLINYFRRKTNQVQIGDLGMGSDFPIRIQSMTTVDTMDTLGSVEQSIRMIESGCELIRITAPSVKEAQNLAEIKKELRKRGYNTPIVADIHFTPNAAELAARIVEKVRINPGNYADKKRFQHIEYTDESYNSELQRIRDRFLPLINICKENGTALRIGTNHGSLSDRILSRYGDTPLGMVESALEFLQICENEHFYNIVVSMKSSNPQVMVQAYRLLSQRLEIEKMKPYPLHLGVTEAGDGEDGRIKSALGIGTLLEDGLGDTVRVSLTEDPEKEAPVAIALVNRYSMRGPQAHILKEIEDYPINPYEFHKRPTYEVENIGGNNVPRVIADFRAVSLKEKDQLKSIGHFYLPAIDKWSMNDLGADFIFTGNQIIPFDLPNTLKQIVDFSVWDGVNAYPLFNNFDEWKNSKIRHEKLNFLNVDSDDLENLEFNDSKNLVLVLSTNNLHALAHLRRYLVQLIKDKNEIPVIIKRSYSQFELENLNLLSSIDIGGLLIDGLSNGLLIENKINDLNEISNINNLGFGILQAARMRITKTEYISCPSCGRTLFDLQETTSLIRKRTDHLKGIKIGIMGCIVNGPGEMADADYGYVGVGKDKIALYRGQEVIKKAVKAEEAVDQLIELIKEDGNWIEINDNLK